MRDDDEFFTALSMFAHAAEELVKVEIKAEKHPGEEAMEAIEDASETVDAAVDHVKQLLREDIEKDDPPPYRGAFLV